MKLFKRIICVAIVTLLSLVMYSTIVKAATTLKVTADTLNLRQKASTSSNILTLLSKGDTCELIEEDGDWYKVKYKTYTGYVSKEYAKKVEAESNESDTNTTEKEDTANSESSKVEEDNNKEISNVENVETTGKISKKTALKIVPLIYSSEIDTLNKDKEITILSEINGWAYIQTETVTGWVRTDSITERKTNANNTIAGSDDNNDETTNQTDTNNTDGNKVVDNTADINNTDENYTKKTMYVNDSFVNVRKEPNTSSKILMTLAINTKLTVLGESGDWYKVSTSVGEAYVSKELLSSKQVTTSRGGITTSSKKIVSNSSDNVVINEISNKETTATSVNSTNTQKEVTESTSSSINGQEVVTYAKQFLGVPYVYGGASKSGFDCSGFTMYVYKKFGISMRHGAQAQAKLGTEVSANKNSASSLKQNLKAGDLVFFLDYETMDEIGHCGIYIGNGEFIHASSGSGYCVKINSLLPGEYYNTRYCGARRVI